MTVHQHALEVRAFAQYLRDLAALLEPGRGWYGVFCARDPDGMRACLDGAEVPPWDVVDSLLQDLAALRGAAYAARESVRAAELCAASAAAYDRRPGGRQALADRLDVMVREQADAAGRMAAGAGAVAARDGEPDALAWARDDHTRATARCAELRDRLAAVERAVPVPDDWFRERGGAAATPAGEEPSAPGPRRPAGAAPGAGVPGRDAEPAPPAPSPGRRKPRGARFAGLEIEDAAEADPVPPADHGRPAVPAAVAAPRPAIRGSGSRGGPLALVRRPDRKSGG
ncbi:hypothetical protein ABZ172_29990, partial [Streptomyces sp. NPDC006296]